MVGVSYGGGIQLVTAAIDHRVDAIVPTIAWHSLITALNKNDEPKTGWGLILTTLLLAEGGRIDPHIVPAILDGLRGWITPEDASFIAGVGPGDLVNDITAPTLLIQGTVDTLFTLQEADDNAKMLLANGVPTKVVWYCGGHGGCITSQNDGEVIERSTMQWLDRYVKGNQSTSTGPQFEWVDQHGQNYSSDVYPVPTGAPLEADGPGGTLPLRTLLGGSGPQLKAFDAGLINGLLGVLSGAKARNAVELTTPAQATTTYIVGAPQLTFTYSGTGSRYSRHVYAQLVDNTTELVLGNLVTPIPVTLDGQEHTLSIPLEQVAQTLRPGETVTLQIVASAVPYQRLWTSGRLNISSMQLTLPTANASAISSPGAVLVMPAA
jgi:ABC-2 type transport system ATP-binding protein